MERLPSPSPSRPQLRRFGLIAAVLLPLLLGWLLPAIQGEPFRLWTLWPAGLLLVLSLLAPRSLAVPAQAWSALVTLAVRLVLIVLFVLLQPLAFVLRLLRYDPLRRRRLTSLGSYREQRRHGGVDLRRQF